MPNFFENTSRILPLNEQDRTRWTVRWRSWFPHTGFREHQRVPLWHDQVPFVLITSQKAGSTLGVAWFFHHAGLLEEARSFDPFVHQNEQNVFLKKEGYLAGLEAALQKKPVYKLVREPGARAYSSYLALLVREALEPRDHRTMIRNKIAQSERLDLNTDPRIPLAAYLSWLANSDHQRLDGHEARQFNLYEDTLLTGRPEAIQLEKVADGFRAVEKKHGLPLSSEDTLADLGASSHYAAKVEDPEGVAAIMHEGVAVPRPNKVPQITTTEIAQFQMPYQNLIKAYGEDYRRYGYPLPS